MKSIQCRGKINADVERSSKINNEIDTGMKMNIHHAADKEERKQTMKKENTDNSLLNNN